LFSCLQNEFFIFSEYTNFKNCFSKNGKNVELCSEDQLETVTDFIDSVTSNLINLLCGDYTEGNDKCEKLEASPKKNNSEKRTKSFFLPFVQVFESFAEI
jgi:hypothetical protein